MFECPAHLTPIKPIGKGAYGIVCSATDTRTNEKVAIKKIGARPCPARGAGQAATLPAAARVTNAAAGGRRGAGPAASGPWGGAGAPRDAPSLPLTHRTSPHTLHHPTPLPPPGGIFDNPLDAKRTLREIRILRHLHAAQRHANIISLHDLFPPPSNARNFRDLYMVTEVRGARGPVHGPLSAGASCMGRVSRDGRGL